MSSINSGEMKQKITTEVKRNESNNDFIESCKSVFDNSILCFDSTLLFRIHCIATIRLQQLIAVSFSNILW